LWLGPEGEGPDGCWEIAARSDCTDFIPKASANYTVSAATGAGLPDLKKGLVEYGKDSLPRPGEAALNARQSDRLKEAYHALASVSQLDDLLLIGEELRRARLAFDRLIGRSTTEDMLDALFGRFCIGK
jgi:tRNA modification GTPase